MSAPIRCRDRRAGEGLPCSPWPRPSSSALPWRAPSASAQCTSASPAPAADDRRAVSRRPALWGAPEPHRAALHVGRVVSVSHPVSWFM
jgi:hypothetical protein